MLKVVTILGTRPEIIKLSRVINKLDLYFKHVLVHSSQNYDYELNKIFFDSMHIRKPDFFLNSSKKNAVDTIAETIKKFNKILIKIKPDAVLVYGDTNTALAVLAAKKLKIPIFHMEAGNRCFDNEVPEEINRKIVDHLSDINIVISENAKNYLEREGVDPSRIIKSGSSMNEVLKYYQSSINKSKILNKLKLKKKGYILYSFHREENVDKKEKLEEIIKSIDLLVAKFKSKIIVSTHPRTKDNLKKFNLDALSKYIEFKSPFSFIDYIKLQKNSKLVISDSGTISEEAYLLKIPAVNMRYKHERPEADAGSLIVKSEIKGKLIYESAKLALKLSKNMKFHKIKDYESEDVSTLITKIIMSFAKNIY